MKLYTNLIANPSGSSVSWDEWLEKNFGSKTASEAKPEQDGDPRGQGRGQVINNDNEDGAHSYQEGESVDGKSDQAEGSKTKKNENSNKNTPSNDDSSNDDSSSDDSTKTATAHCDKEMGESDKAGDVTEDHSDAANADVGKAKVEQNINSEPNHQKGESTDPGKAKGKSKKGPNDKAASSGNFKKIASMNRSERIKLIATLGSNHNNPKPYIEAMAGLSIDSMSRPEKLQLIAALGANKNNSKQHIEAMVGITIANLTSDEKGYLRKYWNTMYPRDYVENMIEDR